MWMKAAFDHPFLGSKAVEPGGGRERTRNTTSDRRLLRHGRGYGRRLRATCWRRWSTWAKNLDDWIIIYTSDHGEMLGEHRLWEKTKFFEGQRQGAADYSSARPRQRGARGGKECQLVRPVRDDLRIDRCPCGRWTGQPQPGSHCSTATAPPGITKPFRTTAASHLGHEDHFDRYENLMIKRDQLKYQYYGHENAGSLIRPVAENPEETINFR